MLTKVDKLCNSKTTKINYFPKTLIFPKLLRSKVGQDLGNFLRLREFVRSLQTWNRNQEGPVEDTKVGDSDLEKAKGLSVR